MLNLETEMNPELEIAIIFCLSIVFQLLYFLKLETVWAPICSVITAVCWMATSQVYLALQPLMSGVVWLFYGLFALNGFLTVYEAGMIFLYGVPEEEEEVVLDV